jgi:high affinity Mn2+ porin
MNRASGCSTNPLRSAGALDAWVGRARINLIGRLGFALVVFAAGVSSYAQTIDSLPSAPQPQSLPVLLFAQTDPSMLAPAQAQNGIGIKATDMSPIGREPQDAPVTAMFSREDSNTWWLSGQANIIFQGRLPFHSLYQGTNSFRNSAEYKTSMVGTVYTAWRPTHSIRYNNDLIFDIEAAEGRGLSEALGLAGFTNLDVVRNPYLGRVPYIARYQIHQVFGFTNQTTSQ